MSGVYRNRLRKIQNELSAARQAIAYVRRHWQQESIIKEIEAVGEHDFLLAADNIEAAYFVRLYAEFEGILKDHLASNHPGIKIVDKPKVDWLISRVVRAERITVDPTWRRRLDAVRDYRNSIAHHEQRRVPFVAFGDALLILNHFLSKLPEPYKQ